MIWICAIRFFQGLCCIVYATLSIEGKTNQDYSGENAGDMYAEVKKPKKNKSAPAAPEVTYAAVDKKKKKGAENEGLHGSPGS